MSLRYYLAQITGTGMFGDSFRPNFPEGVENWVALIQSNPDGTPKKQWILCLVDTPDHTILENLSHIIALPLAPDTPMSTIPNNQRNQYINRLSQNGYPITINWSTDLAIDVVDRLALLVESTYERGAMSIHGQDWSVTP